MADSARSFVETRASYAASGSRGVRWADQRGVRVPGDVYDGCGSHQGRHRTTGTGSGGRLPEPVPVPVAGAGPRRLNRTPIRSPFPTRSSAPTGEQGGSFQ